MTTELIKPRKPQGYKKMSVAFGNGRLTNARNSREIHKYLGVKTEYAKWIERRIKQNFSEKNIDFTVVKSDDGEKGQFSGVDYIVTDDFAKHLGMMERNEIGKQVRNYFIYMTDIAKYLLEDKILKCELQTQRVIERKDKQIEKLKSSSYAKPREGNFQVVDRIRQDYNIKCSTQLLYSLLVSENLISIEYHQVASYISTSNVVRGGKTPTVYVESLLALVDNEGIPRDIGYVDINPSLFKSV